MTSLTKFDTKTKASKGVEIELKDLRTGKRAGAFITILGADSDQFQDAKTEQARALADSQVNGDRPGSRQMIEMTCRTLAACTIGWRELEGPDGQPLPFSEFEAQKLYSDYPAIRDQINEEMANRANFVLA